MLFWIVFAGTYLYGGHMGTCHPMFWDLCTYAPPFQTPLLILCPPNIWFLATALICSSKGMNFTRDDRIGWVGLALAFAHPVFKKSGVYYKLIIIHAWFIIIISEPRVSKKSDYHATYMSCTNIKLIFLALSHCALYVCRKDWNPPNPSFSIASKKKMCKT